MSSTLILKNLSNKFFTLFNTEKLSDILLISLIIFNCFIYLLFYDNYFAYDDFQFLANNLYSWREIILGNGQLRIIPNLIWSIYFYLFHTNPIPINIFSIIIHIINIFLIYNFLKTLFKFLLPSDNSSQLSLYSTSFFAILSSYSDIIFWKTALSGLLSTMFSILSLKIYLLFLNSNKTKFYLTSFLLAILAMLSKEDSAFIFFIILYINFLKFGKNKKSIKLAIPFLFTPIFYVFISHITFKILKNSVPNTTIFFNLNFLNSLFGGLAVLITPYVNHSFKILSALLPIGLLFYFLRFYKIYHYKRIFFFCLFWIFISYLPSSLIGSINLFNYKSIIIWNVSRFLYLPSICFSVLLGLSIYKMLYKKIFIFILLFIYMIQNLFFIYYRGTQFRNIGEIYKKINLSIGRAIKPTNNEIYFHLKNLKNMKYIEWMVQAEMKNNRIKNIPNIENITKSKLMHNKEIYLLEFDLNNFKIVKLEKF